PAHAAVADRVTDRVSLCRILPQHAAVGAVVPLVLRFAGTVAACVGDLAEADPERAILYHHDRRGVVHVGPGGRAIAGGHRIAATRTEARSDGAGPDHDTVLSLRAAADRVPHHHAAADVGISQHHQEHLGWNYHRPDRADRRGAFDAGILVPGVRGFHRCDRAVPAGQYRGRRRHAPARAEPGDPRLYRRQVSLRS